MNNLKEGMYVRTILGYIRRITEILTDYEEFDVYRVDKEFRESEDYEMTDILCPNDVIKSSENLIDLIEEEDYVNDYKVNRTEKNYIVINEIWHGRELLRSEDIKSIVTKEQFFNMEYRLGDE